jgi:hypothetical protein
VTAEKKPAIAMPNYRPAVEKHGMRSAAIIFCCADFAVLDQDRTNTGLLAPKLCRD